MNSEIFVWCTSPGIYENKILMLHGFIYVSLGDVKPAGQCLPDEVKMDLTIASFGNETQYVRLDYQHIHFDSEFRKSPTPECYSAWDQPVTI